MYQVLLCTILICLITLNITTFIQINLFQDSYFPSQFFLVLYNTFRLLVQCFIMKKYFTYITVCCLVSILSLVSITISQGCNLRQVILKMKTESKSINQIQSYKHISECYRESADNSLPANLPPAKMKSDRQVCQSCC